MNIGPKAVRLRRRAGIAAAALSVAALILLVALGAPMLARLLLLPLFFTATLGFLQAREKT
jgi:biotin transporter BioY